MVLFKYKEYLFHLQNLLIRNQVILSLLSLIEFLPLLYHSFLSSFNISQKESPSFLINSFKYLSLYDDYIYYIDTLPNYLYIIELLLLILFLIYKFILFPYIKNILILNSVLINFFELIYLKVCCIFIIDLGVRQLYSHSIGYCILFSFYISILFAFFVYNMSIDLLYIDINSQKHILLNNRVYKIQEKYLFLCKCIICFIIHSKEDQEQKKFFDCLLLAVVFFSFIHLVYYLYTDKVSYFTNALLLNINFYLHSITVLLSLEILLNDYTSKFAFWLLLSNSLLISICITQVSRYFSLIKMRRINNPLGVMIYLINEPISHNSINEIITNHKIVCEKKECNFCKKSNQYKLKDKVISSQLLCKWVYKYCFEDNYIEKKYLDYYYLIELYCHSLSKKTNIIKLAFQYNKILSLVNIVKIKENSSRNRKAKIFSNHFLFNLELLYESIISKRVADNDKQRTNYLITIDSITNIIKKFIKKIISYLKLNVHSPKECIEIAKQYTILKREVDIDFLFSKDYKMDYNCILCAFVLEGIFNDQINKTVYINEFIHSVDELLDNRFKDESSMLVLYDLLNSRMIIRQTGNQLIDYKNKLFEQIFPGFLRKEGKSQIIKGISSNAMNSFTFYYMNPKTNTFERIRMKFSVLPSLTYNKTKIYIAFTYRIQKENLVFFQVLLVNHKYQNVLVGISERASVSFKLPQTIIDKALGSYFYLLKSELLLKDNSVNFPNIKTFLQKNNLVQSYGQPPTKHLELLLKEQIGDIEVYKIKDHAKRKINGDSQINTKIGDSQNTDKSDIIEEMGYAFNPAQTGVSSSTYTNSSASNYKKTFEMIKNKKEVKYRMFFRYTYYLIFFNVIILCILIIFLGIELMNNAQLENIFNVITNFYDFQSTFYIISLSIFSLTCNSDNLSQIDCVNQFQLYSEDFVKEGHLSSNQLMNIYIARELAIKTEVIISTLQQWERDNDLIYSKEITEKLNENFIFTALEEVDGKINSIKINLNFEAAIKRFVTTVNLLTSMEEFLTSPVFIISTDGEEYINMENVIKEKQPINGAYMNESQKYYYTLLLNYQKYLLKLLVIGNLLYDYYEKKISKTSTEILIFILTFIVLHISMIVMCFVFIEKFKNLHIEYYISIADKISDNQFVEYYENKLKNFEVLIDLYRENPTHLIHRIVKNQQKEEKRKLKGVNKPPEITYNVKKNQSNKNSSFDIKQIKKVYSKEIANEFILIIGLLFSVYFIILLTIYSVLIKSINRLSTMNSYTKNNYDLTNYISINMGLVQLMSLTNQTDYMLSEYFTNNDASTELSEDGYVHENIQKSFALLTVVNEQNKYTDYFKQIADLIDMNCDTMYEIIDDPYVNYMFTTYPDSNYQELFRAYCKTMPTLTTYKNNFMSLEIINYKIFKLLNLFVDQEYDTYANINNSDLLYTIYTDFLILIRPLRRRVYKYIIEEVITYIISQYNLIMIIFIFFNFIYETILLVSIKLSVINRVIQYTKEIITLSKALECFV